MYITLVRVRARVCVYLYSRIMRKKLTQHESPTRRMHQYQTVVIMDLINYYFVSCHC